MWDDWNSYYSCTVDDSTCHQILDAAHGNRRCGDGGFAVSRATVVMWLTGNMYGAMKHREDCP